MGQLFFAFLFAYFLTNLLEFVPFSLIIKGSFTYRLSALLVINLITLPLLWLALPFFYQHYIIAFLIAEAIIVIAEAGLIKMLLRQTFSDSFKCSAFMNVVSAAIGFVFF